VLTFRNNVHSIQKGSPGPLSKGLQFEHVLWHYYYILFLHLILTLLPKTFLHWCWFNKSCYTLVLKVLFNDNGNSLDYIAVVKVPAGVWSTKGMIQTGENGSTWRKSCPSSTRSATTIMWTGMGLKGGSCMARGC
jgi:hypothetical protein